MVSQRRAGRDRRGRRGRHAALALPADPGRCRPTSPPSSPGRTTWCREPSTTAIPLGIYCRKSLARATSTPTRSSRSPSRASTSSMSAFDCRYPFGKYDQLFVPEFNAGAMENAGCVTFLEDYVFRSQVTDAARREPRAETILHEMAHMWFGDLVTMRWWDDLWLNESFADLRRRPLAQAEATRWTEAWTTFAQAGKTWALPAGPAALDAPDRRRHPGRRDGRGQLRRHHLRQGRVGAQAAGRLRRPGRLPGRAARATSPSTPGATPPCATCSPRSRRPPAATWRPWSKEWLETAGVNTLRPEFETRRRRPVHQRSPSCRRRRRATRRCGRTGSRSASTTATGDGADPAAPGRDSTSPARAPRCRSWSARRPDLVLVNDDDLTYAKIRLDDRSLRTLRRAHRRLRRPAARGAVLDGGLGHDPRRRDAPPATTSAWCCPAWTSIAGHRRAADRAAPGGRGGAAVRRPGLARRRARSCWPPRCASCCSAAEPGSDRQLAYAQALARRRHHAGRPRAAGRAAGRIRRASTGSTVDTELRWLLLRRLRQPRRRRRRTRSTPSWTGTATDAGERHAAPAGPRSPTPAAKEAAWARDHRRRSWRTRSFRATLDGFADPTRITPSCSSPTRSGTSRWSRQIWADWTSDMAQCVRGDRLPAGHRSPGRRSRPPTSIIARDGSARPPLRRLLVEGRDDVARALRCQERDRRRGPDRVQRPLRDESALRAVTAAAAATARTSGSPGRLLEQHAVADAVAQRDPPVRVLVVGARHVLRPAVTDRVGQRDADQPRGCPGQVGVQRHGELGSPDARRAPISPSAASASSQRADQLRAASAVPVLRAVSAGQGAPVRSPARRSGTR